MTCQNSIPAQKSENAAVETCRELNFPFNAIAKANATSRGRGAVSYKALVPRYVRERALKTDSILDFGAGKEALHAKKLQEEGFNVTAYDFGQNLISGIHDVAALDKKYDLVYASNVLNVQDSEEMLLTTLRQITTALNENGRFIVNLPAAPRERFGAWQGLSLKEGAEKLHTVLRDYFQQVERIGGTASAPVFEAQKPIILQ